MAHYTAIAGLALSFKTFSVPHHTITITLTIPSLLSSVQIFALLLLLVAAAILTSPEDVDPLSYLSALKDLGGVDPANMLKGAVSSVTSLFAGGVSMEFG